MLHRIWSLPGVILSIIRMGDFGAPYQKLSGYLHNLVFGSELDIQDQPVPERLPQFALRGLTEFEGKQVWRTRLAQNYVPTFCCWYALVAKRSMEARLLALRENRTIPMANKNDDAGKQILGRHVIPM